MDEESHRDSCALLWRRAARRGIAWLGLGVSHSRNPTAAKRAYEKCGFVLRAQFTSLVGLSVLLILIVFAPNQAVDPTTTWDRAQAGNEGHECESRREQDHHAKTMMSALQLDENGDIWYQNV